MSIFRIIRKDRARPTEPTIIETDGLSIGRELNRNLVLNHPAVSLFHAGIRFRYDDAIITEDSRGAYWLYNHKGKNGTVVNGRLIEIYRLKDKDVIQIGPFLLHIASKDDELYITVEMKRDSTLIEMQRLSVGEAETRTDAAQTTDEQEEVETIAYPQAALPCESSDDLDVLLPANDVQAMEMFWQEKRRGEDCKINPPSRLRPKLRSRLGKMRYAWRETRDLKRLWHAPFFTLAAIALLLISIKLARRLETASSPGDLAAQHASIQVPTRPIARRASGNDCASCHNSSASLTERCSECHTAEAFTPLIYDKHQSEGMTCVSCHLEHQGAEKTVSLISYGICDKCHNGSYKIKAGTRIGQTLAIPHGDSWGNPKVDGQWQWSLTEKEWAARGLPEKWAGEKSQDQFHLIHLSGRMAVASSPGGPPRMSCRDCHTQGTRGSPAWLDSPKNECNKCHGLSFTEQGIVLVRANCSSCHHQHGESKDTAKLLTESAASNQSIASWVADPTKHDAEQPLVTTLAGTDRRPRRDQASLNNILPNRGVLAALTTWLNLHALLVGVMCLIVSVATIAVVSSKTLLGKLGLKFRLARTPEFEKAPRRRAPLTEYQLKQKEAGPAFPHPVIDPALCIGCHACVEACPHDVIAITSNGKAVPVRAEQCMEDTACEVACPTEPEACVVVYTGKTIPPRKAPDRDRQTMMTEVEGVYIIGELAGRPLIKFAINEGAAVIKQIVETLDQEGPNGLAEYDVAIIGAGPAGLSAAVIAKQAKLRKQEKLSVLVIEQYEVAATIKRMYPNGKFVFYYPNHIEANGGIPMPHMQTCPNCNQRLDENMKCRSCDTEPPNGNVKEVLLAAWKEVISGHQFDIKEHETFKKLEPQQGFLRVLTTAENGKPQSHTARKVVLAIGTRGSPMSLHLCSHCGKSLSPGRKKCLRCQLLLKKASMASPPTDKIQYRLGSAADYVGKQVLVIGGGNSAVEAAVALCGFQPGDDGKPHFTAGAAKVTLAVRSGLKNDVRLINKMNLYDCKDANKLTLLTDTELKQLTEHEAVLHSKHEGRIAIPCDAVFAMIGTKPPLEFLKESAGIEKKADAPTVEAPPG